MCTHDCPKLTPDKERALRLVSDQLWFAERNPRVVEEAAKRSAITPRAALALMIVEELFDAFEIKIKPPAS